MTFLPLQITLYFNVFFSPLWMIACVLALERKVHKIMHVLHIVKELVKAWKERARYTVTLFSPNVY